jgi:hypothetical protein
MKKIIWINGVKFIIFWKSLSPRMENNWKIYYNISCPNTWEYNAVRPVFKTSSDDHRSFLHWINRLCSSNSTSIQRSRSLNIQVLYVREVSWKVSPMLNVRCTWIHSLLLFLLNSNNCRKIATPLTDQTICDDKIHDVDTVMGPPRGYQRQIRPQELMNTHNGATST